jgi:hypothetical protein
VTVLDCHRNLEAREFGVQWRVLGPALSEYAILTNVRYLFTAEVPGWKLGRGRVVIGTLTRLVSGMLICVRWRVSKVPGLSVAADSSANLMAKVGVSGRDLEEKWCDSGRSAGDNWCHLEAEPDCRSLQSVRDFRVGKGWFQSAKNHWRRGRDSNPRYGYPYFAFRVRRDRPALPPLRFRGGS